MKKRVLYLLFLNIIFFRTANTQTLPSTINFKTPEVASINKFVETPVSLYTGVPNIEIPLFEMNIKDVRVPITLRYHAGGIKVDEEATWVGLGWSLDYGGNISRKVRGVKDEDYFFSGATDPSSSIEYYRNLPGASTDGYLNQRYDYLNRAKYGSIDYMPDEFYYSALGYSGKFMFSQKKNKFILFPKEDIKIERFWNLKLPNGTAIDFGQGAVSTQINPSGVGTTTNSWMIKAIHNVYNEDIIYNYENFSYSTYRIAGQTFTKHSQRPYEFNTPVQRINYTDSRLQSISFPGGSINFITITRTDMPTRALSEIDVLDRQGGIIKKISFQYSYFFGSDFDALPMVVSMSESQLPSSFKFQRLRLDSVLISGSSGQPLKYQFDYYTKVQMPSKFTFSQDHYGFYNGIANTSFNSFMPNLFPTIFQGGDRRVKPENSNVFSLKNITYPEGGKTEFVYENNNASISSIPGFLLNQYQDDNFIDKQAAIGISSYSRNTSYPLPDYTDANGARYFKKQFTVSNNGLNAIGIAWSCWSDFGISAMESSMWYDYNNVDYKLERIESDGSRSLVYQWNNTQRNSPYTRTSGNNSSLNTLVTGNYELTVKLTYLNPAGSAADNQHYSLYCSVSWRELNPQTKAVYTGGLRIKEINYFTATGQLAKKKSYSYINPNEPTIPNFTSGRIVSFPNYYQRKVQVVQSPIDPKLNEEDYLETVTSYSSQPLETTSGAYSGYEYVDEYDVDYTNTANKFRTSYHFSFLMPYFSQYYTNLNLGILEPNEWTRGKLLNKTIYKDNSVLKKEDYSYYYWSPHLQNGTDEDYAEEINMDLISYQYLRRISSASGEGERIFPADFFDNTSPSSGMYGCVYWHYGADFYHMYGVNGSSYCDVTVELPYFLHYTGFDKPKSKMVTTYDDNGNAIVQTENYYYDNTPTNYQLTRTESNNSKGELLKITNTYPNNLSTQLPYATMISRNMINPIIEQSIYKNSTFLKSSKTHYQDWGNNIIVPNLTESKIGNFSQINLHYNAVDLKGNVIELQKENDIKVVYIWDYNQQYPIAQISNASKDEVAYTSFESDGKGNWAFDNQNINAITSITGDKSYSLLPNQYISSALNLNTTQNYTFSFWAKGGKPSLTKNIGGPTHPNYVSVGEVSRTYTNSSTGWTYFEYKITNTTGFYIDNGAFQVLAGFTYPTIQLDELRLFPSTAQMVTYTYKPLVGITSQCDANGRITYYEYDAIQRLSLIRDQNNNILKKYCYNYWGQVEDCGVGPANTPAQWQATGLTRCKPCPQKNNYSTNIQQQQEVDVNQNSVTVGATRWVDVGYNNGCGLADWQNTTTTPRCRIVNGNYTSEQEQEQIDMNPCSPTGGVARWVVVTTNCSVCPKVASWQPTGNYRCVQSSGVNTGEQQREERDMDSCSASSNQTRWVSVSANCISCPKPPVWQSTGNYRCVQSAGVNTGEQQREERNVESCSANYNQIRWVSNGENCITCAKPQNWQPTGNYRCVKDVSNNNIGYQEREERNLESCSLGYYSTRWISNGVNTTACPLPSGGSVFAKIVYGDAESSIIMPGYVTADVYVSFYADSVCTIPVNVQNLTVNYSYFDDCSGSIITNSKLCSGTIELLQSGVTLAYLGFIPGLCYDLNGEMVCDTDTFTDCSITYQIEDGSGYTPAN